MSIYTMSLHTCDGSTSEIGVAAPYDSLEDVRAAAIRLARSVMTEEISQGRLCLTCWIVVKNDRGHAMMTVPFGEAIEMLDHPECNAAPVAGRSAA